MKFKGPIFLSVLVIAGFAFFAYKPKVDNSEKEAVIIRTLLSGLKQMHYKPSDLNDDFSKNVFDLYLDRLDGGRRFFTQKDLDQLSNYKVTLDDQAASGSYEFFDLSIKLLNESLKKTQSYYQAILKEPFDFNKDEDIQLDGEKRDFAENDLALKDYWRKYLKYEVLTRVNDELEDQEDKPDEEKKSFAVLEKEAREDVVDVFDRWYDRMFKMTRADRLSNYLNSITNVFDPHTDYLSPKDKNEFDFRMSGKLEGIGARLQAEGDYTKVAAVIVGGPAWKQKGLGENDLIMKVAQDNDGEPVDITGMQLDDVVQLIRGKKGTKVRLTVKKPDGEIEEIPIIRDVVIFEEKYAKSLILDGDDGEKIGYLYLPSFYADFNDRNGRFCAKDVEIELAKLKAANVDGVVFDLRNNGGGSLRDVVKMSGFFIEKGPIVQVKNRFEAPEILKDTDSKVQYDGPLVIMINSFSASASEILAAALQDYGRAVIVGSNSTFGKGTVQRFYSLDRALSGFNEVKPLGDVKMTVQKFYRVNGGSTQLKGVEPDIVLPDNYHYIKTGEKEEEHAMAWTEIDPVEYSQNVTQLNNLAELKALSEARVEANPTFQLIYENANRYKKSRDNSIYPLDIEEYQAYEEAQEKKAEKFKNLFDEPVIEGIHNLPVDLEKINEDEGRQERNEDFKKSVAKDIYIKEVMNIIHDMNDSE